jgi:hypothetical protein
VATPGPSGGTGAAAGGGEPPVPGEEAKDDLGRAELETLGGLLFPAQGMPKEQAAEQERRLKALLEELRALGVLGNVEDLRKLAEILSRHRGRASGDQRMARGAGDEAPGTKPEDVLTLEVPPDQFRKWFEGADDKPPVRADDPEPAKT